MATAVANRVKETTTTSGTGAVTLLGASVGYQAFSAAIGNGNACYYCIADQAGANWEVGVGTYTSSTNTLSRTTVLASSNSGSLVTFGTNTKDVFVTAPASNMVMQDSATGAAKIPVGTTAQRPTGEAGMLRMNSTTTTPEWFDTVTNTWVSFDAPPSRPYAIEVLMVAGGGGGGNSGANYCGGGGAGGCLYFGASTSTNTGGTPKTPNGSAKTVTPLTSYSIVIGAGGGTESSGANTTAFGETAIGGGWGRGNAYAASGGSGGSGGGGTSYNGAGGAGTSGQGYSGGYGSTANQGGNDSGAGGGGGAQSGGADQGGGGYRNSPGGGGQGVQYDILGSAAYYAAGGTGSGFYAGSNTNGIGGSVYGGSTASGVVNTGSGGGGGRSGGGGGGGSGIVVIRYQGSQKGSGGTVTTAVIGGTSYTIHTFTSSGTFIA